MLAKEALYMCLIKVSTEQCCRSTMAPQSQKYESMKLMKLFHWPPRRPRDFWFSVVVVALE